MKKVLCLIIILCTFTSSIVYSTVNSEVGSISYVTINSEKPISVMVDGKELKFDVEPVIYYSRILVPLRAIFEALDAKVTWHNEKRKITAQKDDLFITLMVNSDVMTINDKVLYLDVSPKIIDNRVLVPARVVAEALKADVSWDEGTRTVKITSFKDIVLTLDNAKTLKIGSKVEDLINEMGHPKRKDISINGLEWYIYNQDYSNFLMVGVNEDKVCGLYTNSKGFSLSNGIYYGWSQDEDYDRNYGIRITTYLDEHNNNLCHGVLVLTDGHLNKIDMKSPKFLHIQSLENFDATNAFRVNHGIKPLLWEEYAAEAARGHSQDMADNDYFSHESLDGRRPAERYMAQNKVAWWTLGENISAGRSYGIDTFNGWVNSIGHRENMLNGNYKYLGVGGAYNESSRYRYYMTQSFISY